MEIIRSFVRKERTRRVQKAFRNGLIDEHRYYFPGFGIFCQASLAGLREHRRSKGRIVEAHHIHDFLNYQHFDWIHETVNGILISPSVHDLIEDFSQSESCPIPMATEIVVGRLFYGNVNRVSHLRVGENSFANVWEYYLVSKGILACTREVYLPQNR